MKFSSSLICLDLCNLEAEMRRLETIGTSMLHIDILDGHFSPSMPLGLETVRQLRRKTDIPFDAHVMTEAPDYFVGELLDIGVQYLTFHLETCSHADWILDRIRAGGVKAGLALKPATPLNTLDYIIEKCDVVLLMLINPGYASSKSESQVPYADRKVRALKKMIADKGLPVMIEVDGRVSRENVNQWEGIVDTFVTGTTYC